MSPYGFTWLFFFFNDTATTEIYTLSLHDALPILTDGGRDLDPYGFRQHGVGPCVARVYWYRALCSGGSLGLDEHGEDERQHAQKSQAHCHDAPPPVDAGLIRLSGLAKLGEVA